jgi:hypothetical protein
MNYLQLPVLSVVIVFLCGIGVNPDLAKAGGLKHSFLCGIGVPLPCGHVHPEDGHIHDQAQK